MAHRESMPYSCKLYSWPSCARKELWEPCTNPGTFSNICQIAPNNKWPTQLVRPRLGPLNLSFAAHYVPFPPHAVGQPLH